MNLAQLQAISETADKALAEADQRIGHLKPRSRKRTPILGVEKPVKSRSIKTIGVKACGACGKPTTNKTFCSRQCTLDSHRSKREYKAKKESTKIKRQNTLRKKMQAKATKVCEHRNCDKKLNPNRAIANQKRFCSSSCVAKETHLRRKELALLNGIS